MTFNLHHQNQLHRPISVVIVGSGAAGVFAAAAIKLNCPNVSVTIVHDPNTPYIGVGESIGFYFRPFMQKYLHFRDDLEWMPQTNSTYKLGIVHHGFNPAQPNHIQAFPYQVSHNILHSSIVNAYSHNLHPTVGRLQTDNDLDKFTLVDLWMHLYAKGLRSLPQRESDLSEMFWYIYHGTMPRTGTVDSRKTNCSVTFHINADYVKDFIFAKRCVPAGVNLISKKVVDTVVNDNGIQHLVCDDQSVISGDLFIDCTGFRRLLASKLDFKWIKVAEEFNDSAIVGQGPNKDGRKIITTNYTEHHAMDHGWLFSIPLPQRSGNGYVFNSRIVSDPEKLVDEYNQKFPHKAGSIKKLIKWDPGHYEKYFVKNCITLGISQGFFDPYDANNFSVSFKYIESIVDNLKADNERTFGWREQFNQWTAHYTSDVYFRIQTGLWCAPKDNTVYWKILNNAARRERLHDRIRDTILGDDRKVNYPNYAYSHGLFFNHAMYYDIDVAPRLLPIDAQTEQLALNFFNYFSTKNQIQAQAAEKIDTFYSKLYNVSYE
jgi:tryptophan halogenase